MCRVRMNGSIRCRAVSSINSAITGISRLINRFGATVDAYRSAFVAVHPQSIESAVMGNQNQQNQRGQQGQQGGMQQDQHGRQPGQQGQQQWDQDQQRGKQDQKQDQQRGNQKDQQR